MAPKLFGTTDNHPGYSITELYALVKRAQEGDVGIEYLCGVSGQCEDIIRDLLSEVRRLKTKIQGTAVNP